MKIEQKKYSIEKSWETKRKDEFNTAESDLVIVFGEKKLIADASFFNQLKKDYPQANIIINSTSGEIIDTQVSDNSISLTAIKFNNTKIKTGLVDIKDYKNSFDAGTALAKQFSQDNLKNVLVISDGQLINGSDLVLGIQTEFSNRVIVTGGLAGDGANFQSTLVGLNNQPQTGIVAAIGFYGSLVINYGSVGGWDSFGPERVITKSKDNILYELDGKPALDIYKKYLGDQAIDLPGSGLLFPLSIREEESEVALVRTILNINESEKSLTFAGNMPVGNLARLMKANLDRLIEGSSNAAQNTLSDIKPELAILISCVGRKLVLDQRIEEEVEVVRSVYGDSTAITGFYSYGEIAPSFNFARCDLHNQTMTITTFREE